MRVLHWLQTWATATRARVYVVVVLLFIIPLALFLYSADRFLRRDTSRKLATQSIEVAGPMAERFHERFTALSVLAESFAGRPSLIKEFRSGRYDEVEMHLKQAQRMAAESSAVAVFGIDGKIRAIYPKVDRARYESMASLPWYEDGLKSAGAYVSNVLQNSGSKTEDIAVTMPLRDDAGRAVGLLAFFYPSELLRKWAEGFGKDTSRFLFLVDRRGHPITPGNLSLSAGKDSLSGLEPVKRVLSGQSGGGTFEVDGKKFQSAYRPIGAVGWGVVIAVPFSDIDAAVSKFERPLGVIGGIFLLIALGLGSLGAHVWRRARDSERQTRSVIETAQDGFIGIDDQGLVTGWNHQAEAIFGWTAREAMGARARELVIPEGFRDEFSARLERLRTEGEGKSRGERWEMTALGKSSREFPAEVSIAAIQMGKKRYFNAFVRDITQQKQHHDMIEQKNRELDLRNREVERANQLKSQFLASMSHELRTPLNAILGFSDLLTDGAAGPLGDKQARWVEHIRKGGKHLLQLINDILDLAKIEAGQVEMVIEHFQVSSALPEVISNIDQLAISKQIRLEVDCPAELQVEGDRLRFKQILYNLLSNAVKFTPKGGTVHVKGQVTGDLAEFSVADTGVGIRQEDLQVIFDEFRQVGETTRGVIEGTGLGLAITRRLVEQQNGSIRVESKLGEGTRFTFTLPISRQAIEEMPTGLPAAEDDSKRPLVLIVDDDQAACELIAGYLNPEGYPTATADSGVAAVNLARKLRPSCITLDILMPGASGWETLHELRQHSETKEIPIIVVSVVDQRRLGMALGASDYLLKPVEREALLNSVEHHARRGAAGIHCVAADDDPETLRLMADTLAEAGFSVDLARNGKEALAALRARRTDLLLLDLVMPNMDGFEVIREMADNPDLSQVPTVVLTAKDLSQQELALLERSTRGVYQKNGEWRARLLQEIRRVAVVNRQDEGE